MLSDSIQRSSHPENRGSRQAPCYKPRDINMTLLLDLPGSKPRTQKDLFSLFSLFILFLQTTTFNAFHTQQQQKYHPRRLTE